jgi:hypothetical protein
MTAESIRQIAVQRLQEMVGKGEEKLRQLRYRPPSILNGAPLPGNSPTEVGMVACEINAEVNALERAIDIVNETYKMITNPTTPEAEEQPKSEPVEGIY